MLVGVYPVVSLERHKAESNMQATSSAISDPAITRPVATPHQKSRTQKLNLSTETHGFSRSGAWKRDAGVGVGQLSGGGSWLQFKPLRLAVAPYFDTYPVQPDP